MDGDERRASSSGVDRLNLDFANSGEDTEGGKKERKGVRLDQLGVRVRREMEKTSSRGVPC